MNIDPIQQKLISASAHLSEAIEILEAQQNQQPVCMCIECGKKLGVHVSANAKEKKACTAGPNADFNRLVQFVEDVKQDSAEGQGPIYNCVVEVCSTILKYADDIRNIRRNSR